MLLVVDEVPTHPIGNLQLIGQVPDLSLQGVQSEIEAADETQLLFSIANRGVSFIDG